MSIESDFFDLLASNVDAGYYSSFSVTDSGKRGHIAWPGTDYTPASDYWLEPIVLNGDGRDGGVGNNDSYIAQGTLRVVLVTRLKNGILKLRNAADTVIATFPKGTMLGDLTINKHPVVSSYIEESDRIMLPVNITYSA